MDKNLKLLSDIIIWDKYAKYNEAENRRESWNDIVDRRMAMDLDNHPSISDQIV